MHNNMITINGTKMRKSLGNFITLNEFFTGSHSALTQAYAPMTIRFFILQAHYRSTVDFSNEALQASEKGLSRLMEAVDNLERITPADSSSTEAAATVQGLRTKCYEAMNDDLNSPIVISHLFDATKTINSALAGKETLSASDLNELRETFHLFLFDLLGMKQTEVAQNDNLDSYQKAIDLLLTLRCEAKQNKDWGTADKIRNDLTALGFEIKDTKDGFEWKLNN